VAPTAQERLWHSFLVLNAFPQPTHNQLPSAKFGTIQHSGLLAFWLQPVRCGVMNIRHSVALASRSNFVQHSGLSPFWPLPTRWFTQLLDISRTNQLMETYVFFYVSWINFAGVNGMCLTSLSVAVGENPRWLLMTVVDAGFPGTASQNGVNYTAAENCRFPDWAVETTDNSYKISWERNRYFTKGCQDIWRSWQNVSILSFMYIR